MYTYKCMYVYIYIYIYTHIIVLCCSILYYVMLRACQGWLAAANPRTGKSDFGGFDSSGLFVLRGGIGIRYIYKVWYMYVYIYIYKVWYKIYIYIYIRGGIGIRYI